ncbi:MAG: sulfotransferase domain-containing protein [Gammaproteobacteria bacterium]
MTQSTATNQAMDFDQPMFLGIGVPKGATTWLFDLLKTHPDAWLAEREEVHFFDREINFSKGLDWYRQFFPEAKQWADFKAVGEVTPSYLYIDQSQIEFIKNNLPGTHKFICIVRNPIDRAHSHFKFLKRLSKVPSDQSFDEFLLDPKTIVEQGRYAKYLSRWLDVYSQDQILILVFEEIFQDIEKSKQQVCEFLELDYARFPDGAGTQKSNEGFDPKFPKLYALAVRISRGMYDLGLDKLVRKLENYGAKSLFSARKKATADASMSPESRRELRETFTQDVAELEEILGRKIPLWKDFNSTGD